MRLAAQGIDAFFVAARPGQRLYTLHHPAGAARSAIVHVHAWGEEMNKSRSMVARAARALAASGHAVLLVDLHGCGDSSDDWSAASWDGWRDDVLRACAWMRQRHPGVPLWLWGHRAGALLACEAAAAQAEMPGLLLWQPSLGGKTVMQQFLRLAAAAQLQDGQGQRALEQVRSDLAAGRTVEVAGYRFNTALSSGLERATLTAPAGASVIWLEASSREPATLLPASVGRIEAWRQAGVSVHAAAVVGPAFWQSTEIEFAPALIEASVRTLAAQPQPLTT